MDFLLLLQALILGIVEGLTEFLPISSTGHLIVTADLMNFWTPDKRVVFEIAIQLGAILAVCWDYRLKLMTVTKGLLAADPGSVRFTTNVLVAFLPAAVIGFMMIGYIKTYLFNPMVVATALILGGILILFAERREHVIKAETIDDLRWQDALITDCRPATEEWLPVKAFMPLALLLGRTTLSKGRTAKPDCRTTTSEYRTAKSDCRTTKRDCRTTKLICLRAMRPGRHQSQGGPPSSTTVNARAAGLNNHQLPLPHVRPQTAATIRIRCRQGAEGALRAETASQETWRRASHGDGCAGDLETHCARSAAQPLSKSPSLKVSASQILGFSKCTAGVREQMPPGGIRP